MIATAQSGSAGRSRAGGPGSGRVRRGLILGTIAALLGVLGYGVDALVTHSDQPFTAGNPATWLPSQQLKLPVDRLLVGTYSNPAVAIVGGDVRVKTPSFSALAVVTGPLVPGEGFNYQPGYVEATWTVHIWDVKGDIPLAAADFDSLDHLGTAFKLLPPQGTTMPTSVSTGGQVTFQLRAAVPIGEDLFRWAPDGNNIVAKWDNQVEND